jgi:SapC
MGKSQQVETSGRGALPLFYRKPVLLNLESHRDCGIIAQSRGFHFAREAAAVPLCVNEFAEASRNYPIVFSDTGSAKTALAVLGMQQGRNLIVDEKGNWRADFYQPAYVRRYPFTVAEVPGKQKQLLAIDAASDRFVARAKDHSGAIPLFDETGAASTAARSAIEFCCSYHREQVRTRDFTSVIEDANLLVRKQATINFEDGSSYALDGFRIADEEALRRLSSAMVSEWHAHGWLDLLTLHLASQRNWRTLLRLNGPRKSH